MCQFMEWFALQTKELINQDVRELMLTRGILTPDELRTACETIFAEVRNAGKPTRRTLEDIIFILRVSKATGRTLDEFICELDQMFQ